MSDKEGYIAWRLAGHNLPTMCEFCLDPDQLITKFGQRRGDGHIHHVNHDHSDNRSENVVAVHVSCHHVYHLGLRNCSSETRAKLSRAFKGRSIPAEQRARIAATLRGRVRGSPSEEVRARISATMTGRTYAPARRRVAGLGRREINQATIEEIRGRLLTGDFITQRALAQEYEVSQAMVSIIKNGYRADG